MTLWKQIYRRTVAQSDFIIKAIQESEALQSRLRKNTETIPDDKMNEMIGKISPENNND